jgi:hypothetical protein
MSATTRARLSAVARRVLAIPHLCDPASRRTSTLFEGMKVAAWQAPLSSVGADALVLMRRRLDQCESEGVQILCCPEAVTGGLADYAGGPYTTAVPAPIPTSVFVPRYWRWLASAWRRENRYGR